MNKAKILVIDDEHSVRWAFEKALQKAGYAVYLAETGAKGLAIWESVHPDLTLVDIRMPEMDGLQVLERIRAADPKARVIVMTAYSDMDTTVTAMKHGAYDFLSKPFNIDQCLELIQKGLEARTAEETARPAEQPVKSGGIIGNSPAMQEVYKLIGKVSAEDITVLVTGESGTGKELVARAIHENSRRADKPFWAINCTAVAESLMESELFGYEKGAFTGAVGSKPGVFELAQGGTLFLDELGDMSLEMQAQLLRVLEEREIVRVGGNKKIKVDVRIIAATNKDLRKYIAENKFRDDLFHRIKVIEIKLPPVRERVEDIPALARHFMGMLSTQRQGPAKTLSDAAIESLCAYPWPGNVRELRNAVDQAYTLSRDQIILPEHLPTEIRIPLAGSVAAQTARMSESVSIPTGIVPVAVAPIAPSALSSTAAASASRDLYEAGSAVSLQGMAEAFVRSHLKEKISGDAYDVVLGMVEKELLNQTLIMFKGNQVQTANYLGITRNTLRAKIEKYGL